MSKWKCFLYDIIIDGDYKCAGRILALNAEDAKEMVEERLEVKVIKEISDVPHD